VRDLGLRYGILTEYTAYLVQEPGTVASNPSPMPMVTGAVAARRMTGEREFAAAKSSARMSGSTTLQAADQAAELRLDELSVGRVRSRNAAKDEPSELKRAGGRVFALRDGVWTDLAHRDTLKVTTIAPFSRAWFDLLEARPRLAASMAAGSPLLLAGARASLKIAEGGTSEWAPGALTRFLQEFEGR
jgi:Ca-activated chloride channel family protein